VTRTGPPRGSRSMRVSGSQLWRTRGFDGPGREKGERPRAERSDLADSSRVPFGDASRGGRGGRSIKFAADPADEASLASCTPEVALPMIDSEEEEEEEEGEEGRRGRGRGAPRSRGAVD